MSFFVCLFVFCRLSLVACESGVRTPSLLLLLSLLLFCVSFSTCCRPWGDCVNTLDWFPSPSPVTFAGSTLIGWFVVIIRWSARGRVGFVRVLFRPFHSNPVRWRPSLGVVRMLVFVHILLCHSFFFIPVLRCVVCHQIHILFPYAIQTWPRSCVALSHLTAGVHNAGKSLRHT